MGGDTITDDTRYNSVTEQRHRLLVSSQRVGRNTRVIAVVRLIQVVNPTPTTRLK